MRLEEDDQLFGMLTISSFIFRISLTPSGAVFIVACITSWCMWKYTNMPIAMRLLPAFGFSLLFWFFAFLVSFVAALGDFLAMLVLMKLFGDQRTDTLLKKMIYFILSSLGFAVAAIFVSIGDHPINRSLEP